MFDESLVLPHVHPEIIKSELNGLKNVITKKYNKCYMIIESVYLYGNSSNFHGKVEIHEGSSTHIRHYYYNTIIKETTYDKKTLYYEYEYDVTNNISYTKYFYKSGILKSLQKNNRHIEDSWVKNTSVKKRTASSVSYLATYSRYGNIIYACHYSDEVYVVEHYKYCKLTHVVLNFRTSTITFEMKTKKIHYTNNHSIQHNIDKVNWLAKDGLTFYNNNRDLLI